jgi:hypothetical protein
MTSISTSSSFCSRVISSLRPKGGQPKGEPKENQQKETFPLISDDNKESKIKKWDESIQEIKTMYNDLKKRNEKQEEEIKILKNRLYTNNKNNNSSQDIQSIISENVHRVGQCACCCIVLTKRTICGKCPLCDDTRYKRNCICWDHRDNEGCGYACDHCDGWLCSDHADSTQTPSSFDKCSNCGMQLCYLCSGKECPYESESE